MSETNSNVFPVLQIPLDCGLTVVRAAHPAILLGGFAILLLVATAILRLKRRRVQRAPAATRAEITASEFSSGTDAQISRLSTGHARRVAEVATYVAAFIASTAVHVGFGVWLLARASEPAGFAGDVIDAISVEVVDGTALESVDPRRRVEDDGAQAAIASKSGLDVPVDIPEVSASQPASAKEEIESARPNETLVKLPFQPEAEIEAAEIVKPEPAKETDPRPQTDRTDQEPGRQKAETDDDAVVQLPQEAKVQGGAASTAIAESDAAPSASTSPGERSQFAMLVREALGPTRPRHEGVKGHVVVTFALSATGAVRSVEVAKTSGNSVIDRAAVAAIQRTTFPTPPAGMSDAQRSYVVSFDFK